MKRTAIELADGRELIYFDERDDALRDQPDQRELPPPPPASQLRYDPLTDEWVAVAVHRQTRTFLPPADQCPLCPSRGERHSEIPAPDYDVAVFENRFPSLSQRIADEPAEITPFTPVRPGQGRCEVVCFTDDHQASFASLSPAGSGWSSTRWPTGRRRSARCPASSRCSASRTGGWRSG